MGGSSSKGDSSSSSKTAAATVDEKVGPYSDDGGSTDGKLMQQGPIHALCEVGEDSILSGGADKVWIFFHVLLN